MTREQAQEMAAKIRECGKFTSVGVRQVGGEFAMPDSPWEVELWWVNARAGNRNLTTVRDYAPDMAPAIARKAMGKATKRDQEAVARIETERQMDRERVS
jgi:hypothetical protein